MILDLIRVGSSEQGTFGVLRIGQVPFALTLERPWRDNETNVSCIPPTEYLCRRVKSDKFGETFEVQGVERRSHILFHKGNTIADTKGCILVGEQFDGTKLAYSGAGYGEFMAKMAGLDEFTLRITEA
jgi:Family of unknown function (DUF5675)